MSAIKLHPHENPGQHTLSEGAPLSVSRGREFGAAVAVAGVLSLMLLFPGGWGIFSRWQAGVDARREEVDARSAHERLVEAPAGPMLGVDDAVQGREVFTSACVACHGPDGKGVAGLGLNLVESDFVALQPDGALAQFVALGRPNAQPTPMPPRAGRDDLTHDDLRHVVVWLRGLQDPRRLPELPAVVVNNAPSDEQKAAALAAAGGDAELAGWIASGDKIFHSLCIACHGKAGVGIQGNGKALVNNEFVRSLDDDGLLAFIKQGRTPSDPKNTTGIQMPPKGGNPAMSDDDILDVISYLRSLKGNASTASKSK
ncbi:MAG: c-type cytochrome [Phycisphaerales bacterium]|nr:c-type cytochrome [Phycisphaerales bacterium]